MPSILGAIVKMVRPAKKPRKWEDKDRWDDLAQWVDSGQFDLP